MQINQSATFFNSVNVCYSGVCTEYQLPWVPNFNQATTSPAVVLTADLGTAPAGLHAYNSLTQVWKYAMPYNDVCSYVSDSYTFTLQLNVTSDQSYPAGAIIYKNGRQIAGTTVTADPLSVYAIVQPSAGGGGGGGNASLTFSNFPPDLPVPAPTDPNVILNNGAVPSSTMKLMTLRSVGGEDLGMVIVGIT